MNSLERYLNTASKGLVGAAKERVMRELRGNLELRAQELQITGLNPAQAMQKALEEMGAPQTMSRAMTRIYTLPTLGRVVVLGLVGVGFSLSSLVAAGGNMDFLGNIYYDIHIMRLNTATIIKDLKIDTKNYVPMYENHKNGEKLLECTSNLSYESQCTKSGKVFTADWVILMKLISGCYKCSDSLHFDSLYNPKITLNKNSVMLNNKSEEKFDF